MNRRLFLGGAFVLASSYALPEWCWKMLGRTQDAAGSVSAGETGVVLDALLGGSLWEREIATAFATGVLFDKDGLQVFNLDAASKKLIPVLHPNCSSLPDGYDWADV